MSSSPSQTTLLMPPSRAAITSPSVFLAGSIEMGGAIDWQGSFTSYIKTTFPRTPITILNPRRNDWDSSWKQDITSPPFKEQVEWELEHLEAADVIALFFDPGTKSPISLLELGLWAKEGGGKDGKLIVCCPEGFWRRGNVQVVCAKFGVQLVETLEELKGAVAERLRVAAEKRALVVSFGFRDRL